jgi:hypothetical protein
MPTKSQAESLGPVPVAARICTCGRPMFPSSRDHSLVFEYRSFECWACGRRQIFCMSVDEPSTSTVL